MRTNIVIVGVLLTISTESVDRVTCRFNRLSSMAKHQDITVEAYDAQSRFDEMLDRVERGDEITITKCGTPVARLVPIARTATADDRREAIASMRRLATKNGLDHRKI